VRSALRQTADVVKAEDAMTAGCTPPAMVEKSLPHLGSARGKLREEQALGVLYPRAARREMSDDETRRLLRIVDDYEDLSGGNGPET
jgi:hypothetical protein